MRIACKTLDGAESLQADYLIFAVGRDPQIDFVSDRVQAQQSELERSGRLYFVGDVKNENFRQTAIAVGDAIKAAMKIGTRSEGDD